MSARPIVLIGGGGHGKVVASIVKKLPDFHLVGYVATHNVGTIIGVPYLGDDDQLSALKQRHPTCAAALGIGFLGDTELRDRIYDKLRSLAFEFPAIVSPLAVVNEDVSIGEGTVVMDGVVVNVGSRIGRCAIVNTRSSIDHDCVIGDYSQVAPGATLSGGVVVGNHTLVGVGATVLQYKTIGDRCIIGGGAVVVHDCLETGTYIGIPAKKVCIRSS